MKRSIVALLVFVVALPLAAQMMGGGRPPGMRGIGDMPAMMSDLTVGPDGTAYVMRRSAGSTTAYELAAVRPSGAVAWTSPVTMTGGMWIELNATTIFIASFGTSGSMPNLTLQSQLTGLNVTTGAKVFSINLDGVAMDVTPFADGAYVIESTTTNRNLVSVSNSGKVNWTLPLY